MIRWEVICWSITTGTLAREQLVRSREETLPQKHLGYFLRNDRSIIPALRRTRHKITVIHTWINNARNLKKTQISSYDSKDRFFTANDLTSCTFAAVPLLGGGMFRLRCKYWRKERACYNCNSFRKQGIEYRSKKNTPWLLVRKGIIPTERPPLVGEFQCELLRIERCRLVTAVDHPHTVVNLSFLDRSRYFSFK
jgi:hypothetical protein